MDQDAQGKISFKTKPRNNSRAMFESKTGKRNEDGSGSCNDTERIPTPELDEIVATIGSEFHRITPGEEAEEVETEKGESRDSSSLGLLDCQVVFAASTVLFCGYVFYL